MPVGLPWGTKPRLILAHLNAEALRQQSPVIEVESSLSAFVKRIRGFRHGREIRVFKDQLSRLSVAHRPACYDTRRPSVSDQRQVVTAFELWPEQDERQRVLWPSTIQLSLDYFTSLQDHAVPLNEADLAALAHSALALDLYAWLAQRLHRINPNGPPSFMGRAEAAIRPRLWPHDNFKRIFRVALRQVRARYQRAIIELDDRGMTLHHSLPPVTKQQQQVMLPPPTPLVHKPLG